MVQIFLKQARASPPRSMFAFINDTSGDVDTTEAKGEDQLQYVLTNSQRRRSAHFYF